jgi:hypothetical protein
VLYPKIQQEFFFWYQENIFKILHKYAIIGSTTLNEIMNIRFIKLLLKIEESILDNLAIWIWKLGEVALKNW